MRFCSLGAASDDGTGPEKIAHIMGPPDRCEHAARIDLAPGTDCPGAPTEPLSHPTPTAADSGAPSWLTLPSCPGNLRLSPSGVKVPREQGRYGRGKAVAWALPPAPPCPAPRIPTPPGAERGPDHWFLEEAALGEPRSWGAVGHTS